MMRFNHCKTGEVIHAEKHGFAFVKREEMEKI